MDQLHREDIKALLRKRYGSVARFERSKGLPTESVSDVLRGRTVARTSAAIAEELKRLDTTRTYSGGGPPESGFPDDTTGPRPTNGSSGVRSDYPPPASRRAP